MGWLVLPRSFGGGSLTSRQQGRVKTGDRRVKRGRYNRLLLAESHLTRWLFGTLLGWMARLPVRAG
jgi:hypothetical protein